MALLHQSLTRHLPNGYTFRGATLADLLDVVYLLNVRTTTDTGSGHFTIADLRQEWQTPGFNPGMDVRLVFDQRERLIGYIEIWTADSPSYPWLWGCVHPEYEGRGIGTALLSWAEARVRLASDTLPTHLRVAARISTIHSQTTAPALYQMLGWRQICTDYRARAGGQSLTGALRLYQNAGMFSHHAYDVYEKEIRAGEESLPQAA